MFPFLNDKCTWHSRPQPVKPGPATYLIIRADIPTIVGVRLCGLHVGIRRSILFWWLSFGWNMATNH